jgi:hypothetical protein
MKTLIKIHSLIKINSFKINLFALIKNVEQKDVNFL